MLSVAFPFCYAECHYAECRYAECRCANQTFVVAVFSKLFFFGADQKFAGAVFTNLFFFAL
jgi:hypothetical protein